LDTGPKAFFGDTTFTGLVSVEEDYVAGKLPWKKGDPYNGDLIENARTAISTLGLFTLTQITPGTELGEGSTLPISINVTERKQKSISVGLNYITNEGPGVKFSWENRNLFNRGELLRTNYELSNHMVTAAGTFKKLDFLKKDQTLRLSVKVGRENTDAYTSTSIIGSGFFDRDLTKKVHAGLGFSLKSASVEQLAQKERFHYLSFPFYFNIDTTNDLLDPVRGHRLSVQAGRTRAFCGVGYGRWKILTFLQYLGLQVVLPRAASYLNEYDRITGIFVGKISKFGKEAVK
jgi:translocation and assembly module TamA